MLNTRTWFGLALTGLLLTGCGTSGSDGSPAAAPTESPSRTPKVQQVSDQTICDLLFRDNGVMVKSVGLMRQRQTTAATAHRAREYAREAQEIESHARADMAAKVEALSHSLRAFADWVDSPAGGFSGDDFAVAGLELGNTCGLDLPKATDSPNAPSPASVAPTQGPTKHLTYFDVTVNSHLHGEGFWAANVTACYVRPHPDANPDGTTRVSTDPWSVLVEGTNGSLAQVPVSDLIQTNVGMSPQYAEGLLSVGGCQTGWITVTPPGTGRFAGMKYAPNDFPNDAVTWQW
jgi:hypothetical protein